MSETKYEVVKFIDDNIELDVNIDPYSETIWLTQSQMAILFGVDISRISRHIKNALNEEEITSGKLAYLLKESFGQKLDNLSENDRKEVYPIIGSDPVYQVYQCDHETIFYSNFNQNEEHNISFKEKRQANSTSLNRFFTKTLNFNRIRNTSKEFKKS